MFLIPTARNFFLSALLLFELICPGYALADQPVAVLLSREIAPYVDMVAGLEAGLGNQPVQRFFLDEKGQPFTLVGRESILTPEKFSALVAVGPEALDYLQAHRALATPLFYAMVLNPQELLSPPAGTMSCGVALNLPTAVQFASLQQQLPTLRRLGILFDPANNQAWFDAARMSASQLNIELLPLQIRRTPERLELVGDFTRPDALMFIPDKSIISQAVIQYVIKQAVLRRIPVVGYNQFFLDSGAALAFVINYRQIGQQVAQQIKTVIGGQECPFTAPAFELKRNPQVWQALDLSPNKETP
jgi:putative ABC transport system substrate-binding protein